MRHAVVRFLRHSQNIIRTLVVKALGSQASEFETNHRYSADAIVSESVADTSSGVDSNETRYSYRLSNRSRRALREQVRHASSRVQDRVATILKYLCAVRLRYPSTLVT